MSWKLWFPYLSIRADLQKLNNVYYGVLSKGLQYCLSVFAAELPKEGFQLLKNFAQFKNKDIRKIIKINLSKTRLTKKYPEMIKEVMSILEQNDVTNKIVIN